LGRGSSGVLTGEKGSRSDRPSGPAGREMQPERGEKSGGVLFQKGLKIVRPRRPKKEKKRLPKPGRE